MAMTSVRTAPDSADLADLLGAISDPVERLLLTGQAKTVHEAEEMYLDSAYPEVCVPLESLGASGDGGAGSAPPSPLAPG